MHISENSPISLSAISVDNLVHIVCTELAVFEVALTEPTFVVTIQCELIAYTVK